MPREIPEGLQVQLGIERRNNMKSETMKALRESAMVTLAKGADIAFKTAAVVLTLKFMGILQ